MATKVNPRKIPKSQADVDRAFANGQSAGVRDTLIIVLYTLQDKFGATEEELQKFSKAFNYTVDSIARGYIKTKDLESVIKEEYGTTIELK